MESPKGTTAVIRQVRFTRSQYARVERAAEAARMPVSTYIRTVALATSGSTAAREDLQRVLRVVEGAEAALRETA